MIDEIRIKKALPTNWQTIANFQLLMAKETEDIDLDWDTVSKGVKAVFDNPGLGQYFIAESEGKIVASLMTTFEWSDWRNKMVWWLQSVYILPDYRRMGIFRKMYGHIQQLVLKNENVSGIRLYVDLSNANARKTYEAVGMDGEHYQVYEWMKEF
jgi:GNAT superfamily N-acetyltransferase